MNYVTNDLFIAENFDVVRYSVFKERMSVLPDSGDKGIRTLDPLRARQVLSQLSYTPKNGGPSGTRTPDLPVMSRLL